MPKIYGKLRRHLRQHKLLRSQRGEEEVNPSDFSGPAAHAETVSGPRARRSFEDEFNFEYESDLGA